MAAALNRTTKQHLTSVNTPDYPTSEWIIDPDLSAVVGWPVKYWIITGDNVTLADAPTRDAIDAAILAAERDDTADYIDTAERYERAFALVVLDEFNRQANRFNALLDAIDAATSLANLKATVGGINNLPVSTPADLKTALRAKLDS